ncbi:uncharacterized protein wu:fc23c09 [Gasterosteus aculeatus]
MEVLTVLLMLFAVSGYSQVLQPGLQASQIAGMERHRWFQLTNVSIPVEAKGSEARKSEQESRSEGLTPETNPGKKRTALDAFFKMLREEAKRDDIHAADIVADLDSDEEVERREEGDRLVTKSEKTELNEDTVKTIPTGTMKTLNDLNASVEDTLKHKKVEEERESRLVAGIILHQSTRGVKMLTVDQEKVEEKRVFKENEDHTAVSDLTPLLSTSSAQFGEEFVIRSITQTPNPPGSPPPVHRHNVPQSQFSSFPPSQHARVSPPFFPPSVTSPNPRTIDHISVTAGLPGEMHQLEAKAGPRLENDLVQMVLFEPARREQQTTVVQPEYMTEYIPTEQVATPKPNEATLRTKEENPMQKLNKSNPAVELEPDATQPKTVELIENNTKTVRRDRGSHLQPRLTKPSATPQQTMAKTPPTRPTKLNKSSQHKPSKKTKKRKKDNKTQKPSEKKKVIKPTHFPYFKDNYCPPDCACFGRVVQCSDKAVDKIPYGIPYNARYILLMNNLIDSIQLDLLKEYVSMEFLVLSNNRLTVGTVEGAFEGVPALKRLYLDRNLLDAVPTDLPASLEELRLDNNRLSVMSEAAWARCPGLLVLSLSNNSLGNGSESLPAAVLSPLYKLRTLNLDHNQLTSVPLGLPLSIKELYLKGNLIEDFRRGAFNGISELVVLDLSTNRLTSKGLLRESLLNATHLESLNLEGNRLKKVPRHLPRSLKTLNLEGNLISSVKKAAFGTLKNLEHLGLARNKIFKVAPGAFRTLPVLHQLDLCHNSLRHVPRQLPEALRTVALNHNRIKSVPRDAFCWGNKSVSLTGLVRVQLEHNLIDVGKLDAQAFRCLRGFQVVHFY